VGEERLNEVVDRLASHNQQHDTAGALQLGAELLDRVSTDNGLAWIESVNLAFPQRKSY
jgi:hypothetical protein